MSSIHDFHEYVLNDLFGSLKNVTSKRMFGGYGYYLEGNIFAIVTSESELYFKVDDTNKARFEALGSTPFIYTGHKTRKPTAMPYWILPESIMEDSEKLEEWVIASANISKRAKKKS